MLLHLMKCSRPNIANITRELSKVNDNANPAAFCEFLHVNSINLEPSDEASIPWKIVCFCNSDCVGDTSSRISVSGFIPYVFGALQRGVMLSSWEAEWVALSETVKKVMLVIQLLRSMKISAKLPDTERVDNVGTILIASSITTMPHIKHVDIRYEYVNEYIEDRVVKIVFVKLAKNGGVILKKIKLWVAWEVLKNTWESQMIP